MFIKLRRSLECRWRTIRLESDRSGYFQQCGMVNALIRRPKEAYYSTLIQDNGHDPKVLFIAKFVVSRCEFANLEWVFLFRQSFEWGRS